MNFFSTFSSFHTQPNIRAFQSLFHAQDELQIGVKVCWSSQSLTCGYHQ